MSSHDQYCIKSLGQCEIDSPMITGSAGWDDEHFVDDDDRILVSDNLNELAQYDDLSQAPSLERAGPRRRIFFEPAEIAVGIVTCGGLCPGLNDVVRGLLMVAHYRYGVPRVYGFQYGYAGCAGLHPVISLTPRMVSNINKHGGTLLGSSRGKQDPARIVDNLEQLEIKVLFVIGGDGTMRGSLSIADEIRKRGSKIAVVGVPKTIDNDIAMIDRSFGFETAYSTAMQAIKAAHNEARGAPGGVAVVKLMGRHSGFIACHATLASSEVNFVLIPEVPFSLEGEHGFLAALAHRIQRRGHAVVVVAEGAGQDLLQNAGADHDASGNIKLKDIGVFLSDQIKQYCAQRQVEVSLKYIDPSYIIRSVPATPADSVYCWRLAQHAVHGAMCGKTEMVVASWHGRLVYVPMQRAIAARKQVDPQGDLWLSVLESTGQPSMG